MLSLALVDGAAGIGHDPGRRPTSTCAPRGATTDVHRLLQEYVGRIPYEAPPASRSNWPVHVAGHPPGALLFFVGLDRLGLGGGLAAGLVVTLIAATTAVAVLVCVRVLGDEVDGPAGRAVPGLRSRGGLAVPSRPMRCSRPSRRGGSPPWPRRRRPSQRRWSLAAGLLLGALRDAVLRPSAARDARADRARPRPLVAPVADRRGRGAGGRRCVRAPRVLLRRRAARRSTSATGRRRRERGRRRTGRGAGSRRSPSAPARSPAPASPSSERARDRRRRACVAALARRGLASGAGGRRDPDEQGRGRADLAAVRALDPAQLRAAARALASPRDSSLQLAVALAVEHLLLTGW